jgi:hypothetical protein
MLEWATDLPFFAIFDNTMVLMPITGHVRSRFLEVAVLQLLDPVRGEPSAYGLDQDSID